jgi:glycerol kinase
LIQDYSKGLFQRRLEQWVQIPDRFFPPTPAQVGMDHVALQRTRADERDGNDEVLKAPWLKAGQHLRLCSRFDLIDPNRISPGNEVVHRRIVKGALEKARATAADIAAVGVTNQRETAIVWDKNTGKPYCNAIVWQDTRTDTICNMLAEDGGPDRFREKAGMGISTYFSGPKIRWLLDNVDGLRAAAERGDAIFGNIDTWVIWQITGGPNGGAHVTDVTNASRTMLMDLKTLDWDDENLDAIGIPRQMLPEIRPSSALALYGHTLADGPFGGVLPVCGDLGDQQAATVGQACLSVGEAKNTYGTGCFMLLNTGTDAVQSKNGLITTLCYKFGDKPAVYALEGSIAITGALVSKLPVTNTGDCESGCPTANRPVRALG